MEQNVISYLSTLEKREYIAEETTPTKNTANKDAIHVDDVCMCVYRVLS